MDVYRAAYHVLYGVGVSMNLLGISVEQFIALFVLHLLPVFFDDKEIGSCVEIGLDRISNCHSHFAR